MYRRSVSLFIALTSEICNERIDINSELIVEDSGGLTHLPTLETLGETMTTNFLDVPCLRKLLPTTIHPMQ